MKRKFQALMLCLFTLSTLHAQQNSGDSLFRRFYIGSSAFVLGNLGPNPPSFYQLNIGFRFKPKSVISIEAITWKYDAPLGIPYGSSFGAEAEKYPGSIREFGAGLAFQQFLYKGIYSSIQAIPFRRIYRDENNAVVGKGFQLFMTLRFGYHQPFFRNRFFIEPSVAFTHWPLSTNVPGSFRAKDEKWPRYFLFEPGFHFGVKF